MRLQALELQGFRAFGGQVQRVEFQSDLAVLWAANSQGKSSFAEAVEFLLTGTISRRELHDGAKLEFDGALRNVHSQEQDSVYVQGEFVDDEGEVFRLRRRLLEDFSPRTSCRSRIELDGQEVSGVEALGLPLSSPPLQAPVVMQHCLRYPLAARPKDRVTYLKALLDVTDLDELRQQIRGLLGGIEDPETSSLNLLSECCEHQAFVHQLRPLTAGAPDRDAVEQALMETMATAMFPRSVDSTDDEPTLGEVRQVFADELEVREAAAFPLEELEARESLDKWTASDLDALKRYEDAAADVQQETWRLHDLYRAVLEVPSLMEASDAVDCPVCETERAFTPQRREALQAVVAATREFRDAKEGAEELLEVLEGDLTDQEQTIRTTLPAAVEWTTERQTELAQTAESLLEEGVGPWEETSGSLETLRGARMDALEGLEGACEEVADTAGVLASGGEVDRSNLEEALNDAERAHKKLIHALEAYNTDSRELREVLTEPVRRSAETSGWSRLIELSNQAGELVRDCRQRHANDLLREELKEAVEEIDEAKSRVLDEKLAALSDEIGAWWQRLRPDEPIGFQGLDRRGAGQRYIDLKAELAPGVGQAGVQRHAAGVLSDSQLNALGLCTFLARAIRENHPFLLLDDPVVASDEEHRATFCAHVVKALLHDHGRQVIVTTHDTTLDRKLRDYYQHLPLDAFEILLEDPVQGAVIEARSDTLQSMIAHAKPLISNRNEHIRSDGATALRRAAERFCKEAIIVFRRDEGVECSITDFDSKNLNFLTDKLEPYIEDPSHLGKLSTIRDTLNPGAHDRPTPSPQALSVAMGEMKALARAYL